MFSLWKLRDVIARILEGEERLPLRCGDRISKGRDQDNAFRAQADGLGWPADRQGLQPSFGHFLAQPVGILAHCWTCCEVMLMRPIRFCLFPNVLVVARQSFVWQIFYTQNQPPLKSFQRQKQKAAAILALRLAGFEN
jgi:hypothetical protein